MLGKVYFRAKDTREGLNAVFSGDGCNLDWVCLFYGQRLIKGGVS